MKTNKSYRLVTRAAGRNTVWSLVCRGTVEELMEYADLDNELRGGMYEYAIVADGCESPR